MNKIYVVSTGFGKGAITMQTLDVIKDATVIVGYTKYVDEIAELCSGKELYTSGMTQEVERVSVAIEKAINPQSRVALISNGDVNVYGMATLLVEIIEEKGLGEQLEVVSISGVTAMTYAASLCGAPISQDFAVISLSDRLTPIEKIEKRIKSALEADFVLGIYNPISKSRKKPYEIFLEQLKAINSETPVCVAKNLGRDEEEHKITTCGELIDVGVENGFLDMSTIIIVGNSASRFTTNGKILTPRGYLDKYSLE